MKAKRNVTLILYGSLFIILTIFLARFLFLNRFTNHSSEAKKSPPALISWQIQFTNVGMEDIDKNISTYDIDMVNTSPKIIKTIHENGGRVICYIDMGSWEKGRPDAANFPQEIMGKVYSNEYPNERWLDIRRVDLLGPILEQRMNLCKQKGFDGIDTDNMDGYTNDTGFPLTANDQLVFNKWVAEAAHKRGLLVGLKNDPNQVDQLVSSFDFILTEECFNQGWCQKVMPFVTNGKPVFDIEYKEYDGMTLKRFKNEVCKDPLSSKINVLLKNKDLDKYRLICER